MIYRTKKIPNDTISVRNDMSNKWKNKISQAFINISHTKKVNRLLVIFMVIKVMKKQKIVTLIL